MMEKKYNWKSIYDGWAKLVKIKLKLKTIPEHQKELILERVETCNNCEERTKLNICKTCGCFLPAKVLLINQKCKLNKWNQ